MAELLCDFLVKKMPAVPHLVGGGLLPIKGKMVLGGESKSNKSFIALSMGLALARGSPLFDAKNSKGTFLFPVYKSCRTLYIDQEVGEPSLQERLRNMMKGENPEVLPFYVKSRDMDMRLDTDTGRKVIGEEIAQVRPDVLILDPLSQFHLSDENSAQEMGAIMRVSDHWIEEFGLSVIFIHHAGHPNPEHPRTGGNKLRGSTAIFAAADSIIVAERQSSANATEPYIRLDFELRHRECPRPCYVRRLSSGKVVYIGEQLPATSSSERQYSVETSSKYKGL